MPSELDAVITLGNDITSNKYYTIAAITVLFYDYFLTLEDEIKYAWTGKKSWTFWLFVMNRYFPMSYQIWQIALSYSPDFNKKICDKSSFYPALTFVVSTLLAQAVLTIRMHAVTIGNTLITTGFVVITASQLVLGICMTIVAAKRGAQTFPPLPFDAYHMCIFSRHRTLEVAYTSLSLVYDFFAFSLTIFLARKSRVPGIRVPSILETIAEDATWYFLVIFTSHFVFEVTLTAGRETIQLLPAAGILVYIPVMISRIMLSLRKAADVPQKVWSLMELSVNDTSFESRSFRLPRYANGRKDEMSLEP